MFFRFLCPSKICSFGREQTRRLGIRKLTSYHGATEATTSKQEELRGKFDFEISLNERLGKLKDVDRDSTRGTQAENTADFPSAVNENFPFHRLKEKSLPSYEDVKRELAEKNASIED